MLVNISDEPSNDTIPPTTRKRKAAEASIASPLEEALTKKQALASAAPEAAPPTPLTNVSNTMDSDDEFLSAPSSEDDLLQDESDNEELSDPEGELYPSE